MTPSAPTTWRAPKARPPSCLRASCRALGAAPARFTDVERILLRDLAWASQTAMFGKARRIDDLAVLFGGVGRLAQAGSRRLKITSCHTSSRGRCRLLFRLCHLLHDLLLHLRATAHLG